MLIDFKELHARHLIAVQNNDRFLYHPANPSNPSVGIFPSSQQLFSNHGLQVGIYLYNPKPGIKPDGACSSVSHCVYLNFTHKVDGRYLLNNDTDRIAFQLDLGIAKELYQFASGIRNDFEYRAVRQGRAPKRLRGYVEERDEGAVAIIEAENVNDNGRNLIRFELTGTAEMAIAAHVLGYARLLYPSISDVSLVAMLTTSRSRAIAGATMESRLPFEAASSHTSEPESRACAGRENVSHTKPTNSKLARVIWAIGNQKWASMRLDALQMIQAEPEDRLRTLIDEANNGDFSSWDAYL